MPLASPRGRATALTALVLLLAGCQPALDPQASGPSPDDCLRDVRLDDLPAALRRCQAVVNAHPKHPQPRHERALLHSLAGDQAASCRDSQAAAALLPAWSRGRKADPLLVEEIGLRLRSCRGLTTDPAAGAPSAETPGGAAP